MVVKVAIVGAGVMGLSCANVIQEKYPNVQVTIFADKFSPGTTSDGAAGLFWPYLLGDTPAEEIHEYALSTWKYLEKLWESPKREQLGVYLVPCIRASSEILPISSVKDFIYGFHMLDEKELADLNKPEWKFGYKCVTFMCEGSKLLPHYLTKFRANNGLIVARKLESLDEIASNFDVVINCSGLGARDLGNDQNVHPLRGHILRVKAPWVKTAMFDDSPGSCFYIIPNQSSIVLGGTHDKDDWNIKPDATTTQSIIDGCISMNPSLKDAEVIYEWVGLRPGRTQLRLEREDMTINGKKIPVLHNYGHSGSGLTLFYGCALKIAEMFEKVLAEGMTSKL